ncbi:MAG TPA: tetratricopeptide repeat protein [Candidatus Acidoferrum sp.]|nr:tetratricopeptide repeat protein [Candidatus Acidoferrum sp.]
MGSRRETADFLRHLAGHLRGPLSRYVFCLALPILANVCLAQLNHIERAANLLNQGQVGQAETEARQALKDPSTRALALAVLGTIRLREGKYGESENFLTQALTVNPHLLGARTSLGNVYLLLDKPVLARKSFQQVLKREPGNVNARLGLAKAEASLRNYQQSLRVADPIVSQLSKSDDGILLLATDYEALGKKEELKALVRSWHDLPVPPSDDLSIEFAKVLITYGMNSEAKEVFEDEEANIAVHPSAAMAVKLGEGYLSLGLLDRAEQTFQLALTLQPGCAICDQNIADIAERQGNSEKALAYLVKAKQQEPENPQILFDFGKVCLQRNLLEDALPALEKAASLKPDYDPFVYVLASAHVAKGNLTKAISLLSGLVRKHPQDSVLNYAIGAVYYLQGNYSEAESSLKQSLKTQPDQVAASYYLALTYDSIGQDGQAVAVFRELLKSHPEHAPSYIKLGAILLRQHQYEEAQRDLARAVSLDPQSVEAHYQFGLLLRRLGKINESENELAESRKLEAERSAQSDVRLRLLLPE